MAEKKVQLRVKRQDNPQGKAHWEEFEIPYRPNMNIIICLMEIRKYPELTRVGESGTAAYWLAAAARGQGDIQGAWDAAQAGWVRAPLSAGRADALRSDLDQLVVLGVVPDRAKLLAQPVDALRLQWEQFKERWKP